LHSDEQEQAMWHRTKDKVEQLKRHQRRSGSEPGSHGPDGRRIKQCSCSERQRPRYRESYCTMHEQAQQLQKVHRERDGITTSRWQSVLEHQLTCQHGLSRRRRLRQED
jgi:hypothetical protein